MSGSTVRRFGAPAVMAVGALVLALLPAVGAQAAPAAPAAPPPSKCTVDSFAPNHVILGAKAKKRTFSVKVSNCDVAGWAVAIQPFYLASKKSESTIASSEQPTIKLSPKGLKNSDAGKAPTVVAAGATDDPEDADVAELDTVFLLRRQATWGSTLAVTPHKVKVGAKVSFTGRLTRVSWNGKKKSTYVGYSKRPVLVELLPAGEKTWITVKTVLTGKRGFFSAKAKATKTGTWRLVFAGNSVTGPAVSKGVKVKAK